jgi:hypothetical protein
VWAVRVSPFAKNTSIATCIPQPPSSDGGINNSYYYTLYAPVSRLSLRLSENEVGSYAYFVKSTNELRIYLS